MRLIYSPDTQERLEPTLVPTRSRSSERPVAHPVRYDDDRAVALVVDDDDPDMRVLFRQILETVGYDVVTCPGPGSTHCDAAEIGAEAPRCELVTDGTRLIVLGEQAERTRLPEAYATWSPRAHVDHSVR